MTETQIDSSSDSLPPELLHLRDAAMAALGEITPAGAAQSKDEPHALMLASRTKAGENLPDYYLVYFLLVDLLGFQNLGEWEKTAWAVPIRYQGRLYSIEHRKFGVGVFAPTYTSKTMSQRPTEAAEADAKAICELVVRATAVAEPYFEWRAERAAKGSKLNVTNTSAWLFERYEFFRDRYKALIEEFARRKDERPITKTTTAEGLVITSESFPAWTLRKEAEWNAQAAIEAFFGWTEHAFIHLAILQGRLGTGEEVAALAASDWKTKFKAALDIGDFETKTHYDKLLNLRFQIRNFMAHGAFGKRGEAFHFHSGAGAVPVLLTEGLHRYSLWGVPAFDEPAAMDQIAAFIDHLWSGRLRPARKYLESSIPSILTYALDGTYANAMKSSEAMNQFVERMEYEINRAANFD